MLVNHTVSEMKVTVKVDVCKKEVLTVELLRFPIITEITLSETIEIANYPTAGSMTEAMEGAAFMVVIQDMQMINFNLIELVELQFKLQIAF